MKIKIKELIEQLKCIDPKSEVTSFRIQLTGDITGNTDWVYNKNQTAPMYRKTIFVGDNDHEPEESGFLEILSSKPF